MNRPKHYLSLRYYTLDDLKYLVDTKASIELDAEVKAKIDSGARYVQAKAKEDRYIYGVNTGFGSLCETRVAPEEVEELQFRHIVSHACGVGEIVPETISRLMMLIKLLTFRTGHTGISVPVVQRLLDFWNNDIIPAIPKKGTVGASGDLAPLAHLALAAIGEGEVFFKGERLAAATALERAHIAPLQLEVKEGLALLNGTQAMGAVGALALHRAERLTQLADVAGAMTLEALKGTPVAFDERIHAARPHAGQLAVAAHLRELLQESEIRQSHLVGDPRVQDAYSLRCMPQVHGAIRTALSHAVQVVEIESGSATDNPLVFSETGEVLSGGNFHGAPLALVFDYAAIALTDLMSITERRIDRLVNPDSNEGLPPFLTPQPGISSGFMMLQVSAVALLNEAKVLAHPASIDNVPTDGGKEDHVSMGMTAATKLRGIVQLAELATAIELLTAAQALEYRPLAPGRGVKQAYDIVRKLVPPLTQDRAMASDIERIREAIVDREFEGLLG